MARSLGKQQEEAKEATAGLAEALRDEDVAVRIAAAGALAAIGPAAQAAIRHSRKRWQIRTATSTARLDNALRQIQGDKQ